MKLQESVAAIGLATTLALTAGCSPETDANAPVEKSFDTYGNINQDYLDAYNAETREERQADFEIIEAQAAEAGSKIKTDDPTLRKVAALLVKGFEYEEPSNEVISQTKHDYETLHLIPYLPVDASLGYAALAPFQTDGTAFYSIGQDSMQATAERFPAELQQSVLVHELTHAVQDDEGRAEEGVSCADIEPEAILMQTKALPSIINAEALTVFDSAVDRVTVNDGTVEYGNTDAVKAYIDGYSTDPLTKQLMANVSQYYVVHEAMKRDEPKTADDKFKSFLVATYCATPTN